MRFELTYILGTTSWCRSFSPHVRHTMDDLLTPSGFAQRSARQSLVPAPLEFNEVTPKSPPGNPVRPIPTDVPPPKSRPGTDPKPRSVP